MSDLRPALAAGYGCLVAWSELLDDINVFPVADGDTGANLRISLAPLRNPEVDRNSLGERLMRAATGNSGNIAAPFFQEFCLADTMADLAERAASGSMLARRALVQPREGTMLTLFDRLALALAGANPGQLDSGPLLDQLRQAVSATPTLLPELKQAGVVDSGALAMYIFFEGFFRQLLQEPPARLSVLELFAGSLRISTDYHAQAPSGSCIDVELEQGTEDHAELRQALAGLGDSLVLVDDHQRLKIHIHTRHPQLLRDHLEASGRVVRWQDSPLLQRPHDDGPTQPPSPLHLITDAAGSLPRPVARRLGISLLDSYIVIGDRSVPESFCDPAEIYQLMRQGTKVSTAQAGNFERHQHYRSICSQHGPSLYLTVGSHFTGNHGAACAWRESDPLGRLLRVLDSGAASGRLAAIAIAVARRARSCSSAEEVLAIAQSMLDRCQEWVFINELKYLVAGGRVSRASGFFGDLLTMKPVITPTSSGVKKLGVVRSRQAQVQFAMDHLRQQWPEDRAPLLLLQYSDNQQWLEEELEPLLRRLLPAAEILVVPLSLTSGVHMGPGTWSLAVAPPLGE